MDERGGFSFGSGSEVVSTFWALSQVSVMVLVSKSPFLSEEESVFSMRVAEW